MHFLLAYMYVLEQRVCEISVIMLNGFQLTSTTVFELFNCRQNVACWRTSIKTYGQSKGAENNQG